MPEAFQRIFERSEFRVQSLNVQAAMGPVRAPKRSQLALLTRHFLERFFNHETASPDGDAKSRMVQIAVAAGLPSLMVAVWLWPVYHPMIVNPPHPEGMPSPPPYWSQVNHHFFFVLYSFVAMGIAAVWEWDLFFPDLLDVMVLGTLPAPARRIFLARVAAIGIFLAGFLVDANALPPLVLVTSTDPPDAGRFLLGHVLGVVASAVFAGLLVLAAQGVLVALGGERLFRKISLAAQGLAVAALVMAMLLFPVLSGVAPTLLQSGSVYARWFPPFWFLAIEQRMIDGPGALAIWGELAQRGWLALIVVAAVAITAYPIAYVRRVRQVILGGGARSTRVRVAWPFLKILQATIVRAPVCRAIFHFIGQTMFRVPRYRIYLVLYGGVGLSVVIATILRFSVAKGHVHAEVSPEGIRAALGIVAFWVIAGLRTAFVSSGNQRGSWILRTIHGRPPSFEAALDQLRAAQLWAGLCGFAVTSIAIALLRLISPPELRTVPATLAQLLVAAGICLLLTDASFLNVTSVAFTGEAGSQESNLAFTVLRYFTFFPLVTAASVIAHHTVEQGARAFGFMAVTIVVLHLWLRKRHRDQVRLYCGQQELEEGEEDFPMKLGLRY
ncbi:hypothetical protein DYQ86_04205 [Acidobacteria bacterium AB60]|nr:hypothetical protein DYQ86_04205 [Acidobacteria bacterium AB60]